MAEDEERRRNEINMFAAFAQRGEDATLPDDSDARRNFDAGSLRASSNNNSTQTNEISAFAAAARGNEVSQSALSSTSNASAIVMDSGTFAKTSSTDGEAGDSNLAAAAAALAIGEDYDNHDNHDSGKGEAGAIGALLASSLPSHRSSSSDDPKFRKMTEEHPMYVEEVRMPRPLFFGPILPPRVLNEARQIVRGALQEQGYEGLEVEAGEFKFADEAGANGRTGTTSADGAAATNTANSPRLRSLPPEVQNIVGALRMYGFGLSAFPFDKQHGKKQEDDDDDDDAEEKKPYWKGTSYVSTFQPVFGETARMYRHKKGALESPHSSPHDHDPSDHQQQQGKGEHQQKEEERSSRLPLSDATSEVDSKATNTTPPMTETEKANASFLANINNSSGNITNNSQQQQQDNDRAVPATASSANAEENSAANSEISMFSMWARGEGAADGNDSGDDNNSQGNKSTGSFGPGEPKSEPAAAATTTINPPAKIPRAKSDQDLFGQWARGESTSQNSNKKKSGTFTGSSFVHPEKSSDKKVLPRFGFQGDAAGTFQRIPSTNVDDDSDDDSIVGSELKKKVGLNEHLDAALASLYMDDGPAGEADRFDEDDNAMLQMTRSTPGGRPLSNLELTNGCVPIYGIDDAPLPVEGDLGIHETKNDEQRTLEQNKSQELIDKYVGPNLFGSVTCPNPATGPNDNHSWNSRAAPSQRYNVGVGSGAPNSGPDRVAVLPVPSESTHHSPKPPSGSVRKSTRQNSPKGISRMRHHAASTSSAPTITRKNSSKGSGPASNKRGARFNARHRYGWWSIPEDFEPGKGGASDQSVVSTSSGSGGSGSVSDEPAEEPLQLPPTHHTSYNLDVDTRLKPGPEQLREENLPLSELHSATSMAHGLPYLSDRPPSYRYLQIDTQAVGFPPLGGEVEPLFCSLAIYNVETINGGANDAISAPMPDLQRCGRVTEVLNFDVVSDQQVEDRCIGSLWPFFASSTMTPQSSKSKSKPEAPATTASMSQNQSLQGTRCGVFPLPSNLNVANLYAVLIVQKVLSEDSDFEIYLKQSKSSRSSGGIDMNKFRTKAEKASNQHGSFLMPFAFGVAPLLQVFGADNPVVASSRAVQIPLFRFAAGLGERQIIDHIMVMLYPRADFRANGIGGPAAVTNGGTAMLVMRNFGYLGLHAVVHSRSSLARDRLVDFTGELQIRRRNEGDPTVKIKSAVKNDDHVYVVPEWHSQFISEPAINGGRNSVDPYGEAAGASKLEDFDDNPSLSPLYAQELASVPLSPVPFSPTSRQMPHSNMSPRVRSPVNRGDIEPYYHTSFCNELLCHPRLLRNCRKGNIVMKVEMREMEWKQEHSAFLAHLPQHGPCVHNSRRGPFLIQGTYTSCAVRSSDPHFLDEVKVKLPLELKSRQNDGTTRTLSLFFTVYRVKFSSKKKKWSSVIPKAGKKRDASVSGVNDVDEATGERTEIGEEGGLTGKCKLVLLSCGFLPVTSQACLIENDLHDVKMMYKARGPSTEMRGKGIPPSSLVVTERNEVPSLRESQASSGVDLREDDTTAGSSRTQSEAELGDESDSAYSDGFPSGTLTVDDLSQAESKSSPEQMSLQVRIVVHSSLHAQNPILCDFLQNESDNPVLVTRGMDKESSEILRLGRDEMVDLFGTSALGSARVTPRNEERLRSSVASISKPQSCSTPEISKHVLRVTAKLWKTLVFGTGETDLAWANPASIMPLRVHAFGSLLQIVSNASLFMSKSGVTQVDGNSNNKFDVVTLGRVASLLFDEEAIFGRDVDEVIGEVDLFLKAAEGPKEAKSSAEDKDPSSNDAPGVQESSDKPKRRHGHQRSNFELFNDTPSAGQSVDMSDPTSNIRDLMVAASSLPTPSDAIRSFQESSTSSALPKPLRVSARARSAPLTLGIETSTVPGLDFSTREPRSRPNPNFKIDSISDFRSNMELGLQNETSVDSFDSPLSASNVSSIMQKFGGLSGAGKKRWMTAPAPGLATIREYEGSDDEPDDLPLPPLEPSPSVDGPLDLVDSELILRENTQGPKRMMRIPKRTAVSPDLSTIADTAPYSNIKTKFNTLNGPPESSARMNSLLGPAIAKTDEEIISAGGAFLDSIGTSLGLSHDSNSEASSNGGRHRKTQSMHRKTLSRCSIDWTTIGDADDFVPTNPKSTDQSGSRTALKAAACDDHDESMSTLKLEDENCVRLPNFVDRLVALGKADGQAGRWFPYTYEVVIMIWTAFLVQQRVSGDKTSSAAGTNGVHSTGGGNDSDATMVEAASNSHRVAIACAPLLFEVIKQSLAYRVKILTRDLRSEKDKCRCPPLAVLDDALQSTLETLISMITDACLDSRNFDSRDGKHMSIDVNDASVRFLRDMFGFLKPCSAYRLLCVYLSRFMTKEGKQWQDRDSSIGIRPPWEITKLRLNAVTALIRFPDFLRVCSPQMNNWGNWWTSAQNRTHDDFFNSVLDHYKRLELPELVIDGALQDSEGNIPSMRPHWLVEIVTEICLQGTEHAEQKIQMRAASLLHELFWASSQQSMGKGTAQVVASMYITFLDKVLLRSSYLQNFASKSQLRKDILPCVLFVLQGAPSGLLRALWRKLCMKSQGKGSLDRFGGIGVSMFADVAVPSSEDQMKNSMSFKDDPDILDMFTLLNMALSTVEYEGCEDLLESDSGEHDDQLIVWHKEYLLSQGQENQQPFMGKRQSQMRASRLDNKPKGKNEKTDKEYFSSGSRKWQAHDASIVIINCSHQIVSELAAMLQSSSEGQSYLKQGRRTSVRAFAKDLPFANLDAKSEDLLKFSRADTVIFVRAAASLYLHSLALRESDIVLTRTFKVSADLVKIFGITMFLEAVGETLQHWMRVVSLHCGGRRAKVRIEATDFLELILRCTWESYGSFFRIRVPLLAVQTEVMERIVAIAAVRYYREERRKGTTLDNFSNASAEASLAPLWRTLDRLHHQPASQNVAFRGALVRLAVKLKKLYRAYIAARALSYINGMRSPKHSTDNGESGKTFSDTDALVRAYRITVLRVINASAGYSKQFLGFHGTSLSNSAVAHYEAVEDSFLDAADVFSPTELPEHRVAWLQMLADFHTTRKKFAEEATCHFQIHATLKQASFLHGSLWSNTPFLPWTNSPHDPVHIDGEAPSGIPMDYTSDFDFEDGADSPYGRNMDGANSSRRIFYRVANSVRANTEDWETGLSKTLFSGVTFAAEYCSVSSWITLREMEEKMVEEAEISGELFLQSGIIESSRFAWNLATQYYSEKFSYGKLANVYGCLARAVVSQVPPIDASQQQEVSISMGRFYRVWFHGGAPDELIGAEFVYRTASWIRLDQFGEQLREVISCIIPDRTPIHLVLDGRADEGSQRNYGGLSRLGPAPLEPVRIKVTPLRPLFAKGAKIRGLPEWFHRYVDDALARAPSRQSTKRHRGAPRTGLGGDMGRTTSPGHRGNNLSFSSSASVFASSGSSTSGSMLSRRSSLSKVTDGNRGSNSGGAASPETELVGVDKFGFLQPVHHKDRIRGNKDWWKPASGDIAQKSLKVTQLQVRQNFPACVTRQAVVHRVVFTLSPLEAGVDGVCQWCSVLFRTAVATNGMAVLGMNADPGIGTDAAKVVADCIHSSRVKEMGLSLLKKNGSVAEEAPSDIFQSTDRLMEDEINKFQQKLARTIVVFLELLHLLIARNRDLLLNLIQERRKETPAATPPPSQPISRAQSSAMAQTAFSANPRSLMRPGSFEGSEKRERSRSVNAGIVRNHRHGGDSDDQSYSAASLAGGGGNVRTDSAIAVQSELQRAFISLTKTLYPGISGIMMTETPKWLRQCCQENYFSLGTYRQTRIPISEELYFSAVGENFHPGPMTDASDHGVGGGGLGVLSNNPLSAEYLGGGSEHRTMESPSASVTSSVYSRNSGSGPVKNNEF